MNKLQKAEVPMEEIAAAVDGWMLLWRDGDKNTIQVAETSTDEFVARKNLTMFMVESAEDCWINDKYQVFRRRHGDVIHLSIKHRDKGVLQDWRDYQQIKNELVGPECEGVQLYPAESRVVDVANQFHLWCYRSPELRIPFGWQSAYRGNQGIHNGQQRPHEH